MEREYNVGTWLTPSDEYIKDIKQTLVENNYANENTPIGELKPIVQQVIDEIPETFERMDLSKKKVFLAPDFTYVYCHSNGIDCYGSYEDETKSGIYHYNLQTNIITKIYELGYKWSNFFDSNDGSLYVSSSDSTSVTSTKGLIYIEGLTATKIIDDYYNWKYFFESSSGDVYVSCNTSGSGFYHLSKNIATVIKNTMYKINVFFEAKNGNVYCACDWNLSGVFLLNGSTYVNIFEGQSNKPSGVKKFFEAKNGDIYVSRSATTNTNDGLFYIKNDFGTKIYDKGTAWNNYYENKNGDVYVSSDVSSGILLLNSSSATAIASGRNSFKYYFESKNGDVYVSSISDYGIYKLSNGAAVLLTTSGSYTYFIEKFNRIYCTGINLYGNGVTCIENDVVTKIYGKDLWSYFFERTEGLIVAQTPQPDGSDFLLIDKDTDQVYLVKGGE